MNPTVKRNLPTIIIVGAVFFFFVGSFLQNRGIKEQQKSGVGPAFGPTVSGASCDPEETFEEQPAKHISNGTAYDDYNSEPGTSGTHWQEPADAGFYEVKVPEPQLVHNMEHGQIVVYYNGLSEAEETSLLGYIKAAGGAITAAPLDTIDYKVVFAAWTVLQGCEELSSEALTAFRAAHQGRAPEELIPPFTP